MRPAGQGPSEDSSYTTFYNELESLRTTFYDRYKHRVLTDHGNADDPNGFTEEDATRADLGPELARAYSATDLGSLIDALAPAKGVISGLAKPGEGTVEGQGTALEALRYIDKDLEHWQGLARDDFDTFLSDVKSCLHLQESARSVLQDFAAEHARVVSVMRSDLLSILREACAALDGNSTADRERSIFIGTVVIAVAGTVASAGTGSVPALALIAAATTAGSSLLQEGLPKDRATVGEQRPLDVSGWLGKPSTIAENTAKEITWVFEEVEKRERVIAERVKAIAELLAGKPVQITDKKSGKTRTEQLDRRTLSPAEPTVSSKDKLTKKDWDLDQKTSPTPD